MENFIFRAVWEDFAADKTKISLDKKMIQKKARTRPSELGLNE